MSKTLSVALSVDALGPHLTGIGRYCLELAERIPAKIGEKNVSYFRGEHWIDDPHLLLDIKWRPASLPFWRRPYDRWERRRIARDAVVHGPNYFLPDWADRGVATIHDLSVFLFPETHPIERVRAFDKQFGQTLQQASLLVTDTETVRQELIAMFGIAPEKVKAVNLGAPQVPHRLVQAPLQTMSTISEGYILCVSTFEPRKRIDRLVRAYSELPLAFRQQFPLVLVGASGWRNEDLDAQIEHASNDGTVRRLGFVSEELLSVLYAGASLFIYPSRYEGFGLPVVEAMANGIPCIIANAECLVEVAKGAAKVVDPDDIVGFSACIVGALQDNVWREQASAAGMTVAASYSWDSCAEQMVGIYLSL